MLFTEMPGDALFIAAFFPKYKGFVIFGIYILGLVVAIICAMILKRTVLKGGHAPFVMELPPYRLPTIKTLWMHLFERIKDFAVRAGTILLGASIVIWFLQSFNGQFQMLTPEQAGESLLASMGKFIAPLFAPLGFGFWQAAVSLVAGLIAKEAVVSTLQVLLGNAAITSLFTTRSAISFLVFTLLYTPCIAAVATIRRELGSRIKTVGVVLLQCVVAWLAAYIAYAVGGLLL